MSRLTTITYAGQLIRQESLPISTQQEILAREAEYPPNADLSIEIDADAQIIRVQTAAEAFAAAGVSVDDLTDTLFGRRFRR